MTDKNGNKVNFINGLSFYALVGIGLVLILTNLPFISGVFAQVCTVINSLAQLIAYGILAVNGYYFVRKKKTAYKIIYAVALTLIVVGLMLPLFKVFA